MNVLCGIDLSLNSTGVYLKYMLGATTIHDYYIISNNRTKKSKEALKAKQPYLVGATESDATILTYIDIDASLHAYNIYPRKEDEKTIRIDLIANSIIKDILKRNFLYIREIIKEYPIYTVGIEGVAFGSTSTNALCELAALNHVTRIAIQSHCAEIGSVKMQILPPSENKKYASGIGNASKEEMMFCWSKTPSGQAMMSDTFLKDMNVKMDDISDAYWLAHCAEHKDKNL